MVFFQRIKRQVYVKSAQEIKMKKEEMCYSDHNEDIRVKGDCDYCGGTEIQIEDSEA